MPSIKALSVKVQKLLPRLKFLWRTDGQTDRGTDGQTDRRMRFNVPTLSRKRGTKTYLWWIQTESPSYRACQHRNPALWPSRCTIEWSVRVDSPSKQYDITYKTYLWWLQTESPSYRACQHKNPAPWPSRCTIEWSVLVDSPSTLYDITYITYFW